MSKFLPTCPLTELPRMMCGCPRHSDSFTLTPEEREFLESGIAEPDPPTPPPRHRLTLDYLSNGWAEAPTVGGCDHETPDGQPLCQACADRLRDWLRDIPALVADLEITLTRQDQLVRYGHTAITPDPEEGQMPYKQAASQAIRGLWRALGGRPVPSALNLLDDWQATLRTPAVAELHGRVAYAVHVAHKVIDRRPAKQFYGYCPNCGEEIWQERINPDEDPPGKIRCGCGYRSPLGKHQAAQLDLGETTWYTPAEAVKLLNAGGEPVAMHEIKNLIYRHGLPRQRVYRARWVNGQLSRYDAWAVQLGQLRTALLAQRVSSTKR